MPADAANRNTCQVELARLIDVAMAGGVVDAVYDYEVMTLEHFSAVEVLAAGTKRLPSGINDTRWRNYFIFEVNAYVKSANTLSHTSGGLNWTAKNVEEKLSEIDKELADVIADNRVSTLWSYIEFADDFSSIVEGRQRVYERETEATDYKIESRLVLVTYIEGGS